MLVLTRKLGEAIAIGDDIKIIVMQVKGKQVRLGIKASPTTSVHREEIYQKIQSENALASQLEPSQINSIQGSLLNSMKETVKSMQSPLRKRKKKTDEQERYIAPAFCDEIE